MVLSYGAFYTLIVICSVILVGILLFGLSKIHSKVGEQAGTLLGLFTLVVGAVFFFYLKTLHTPVVEVRGFEMNEYVLVFTSTFTASDNQEISLREEEDEGCVVINITSEVMFVEKLDYGVLWDLDGDEPIAEVPPHTYTVLNEAPDFYPWDGAPGEITVRKGTIAADRIWVHF